MTVTITTNDMAISKNVVLRCVLLITTFLLSGLTIQAQTSITCLYPFVPTDCTPCIDPSENMVDITSTCATGFTLDIGDPVRVSGTDNCPGATYTVTYTVTDNCGSSATCSQTWVIENEGPSLECPMDLYLDCGDPNNEIYIDFWLNSVQAQTSCMLGFDLFNTYNPNWINGSCPSGFQTVTWFLTDNCGRSTICSATVFVLDHDEPVILQEAQDVLEVCSYNTPMDFQNWLDSHGGAIVEDACSNVTWSTIPANPQLPEPCSEIEVTFIATDGCGWSVETTAIFKYIDCHPPVITTQPMDLTVDCLDDADVLLSDWLSTQGGAIADDACGSVVSWMSDPMDPELTGDCGLAGSVTVVFIAKDECGNEALTNPATFTVIDNTPPEFTSVPDDMTIECVDEVEFGTPEAVDACGMVTITSTCDTIYTVEGGFTGDQEVPPSGSNGAGAARGTYNPATGKLILEVEFSNLSDTTLFAHIHNAPIGANGPVVFTLPIETGVTAGSFAFMADLDASQSAELEAANYYINIHTASVPSGEIRAQLFVKPCIGTAIKTWTATDECGNTATASQSIYFEDTEAPVPNDIPADITVDCNDDTWEFADDPTWTDNCDTDIFTSVEDLTESDPDFCIVYVRAWSAIDDCGNLATVKQRVFVIDTEPPVFTFVPDVLDIDCVVEPYPWVEPIAEDNCGNVTLTFVEEDPNGTICDIGAAIVRVYTATDDCGNTATTEVVLWINPDQGPPEFTFVPEDLTFFCEDGDTVDDIPDATATDDCDPNVIITFEDEFNTDPDDCGNGFGYDVIRTWTATDHCGNTATATTLAWFKGPFSSPPGGLGGVPESNQLSIFDLEDIKVNPNPATNELNVVFGVDTEQETTIRIFNILGKEVKNRVQTANAGHNTTRLDVGDFIPGTYLLTLEVNGKVRTKKFIKR